MFNIFFLVAFAIALGMALAILITRSKPNSAMGLVPLEEEADAEPAPLKQARLDQAALFKLAEKLCVENGLTVKEKIVNNERETYWVAETKNDFYFGNYVLGFITGPEGTHATMSDVLEFKDFIKSVQSGKGFLFTNRYFTRDVHQPLEGPKVALYNRKKVFEEMQRLSLI